MNAAGGTLEGGTPAAFPWREAMAFGLSRLRLPPDAFWRMTPRELSAALVQPAAGAPDRAALQDLLTRFPDETV